MKPIKLFDERAIMKDLKDQTLTCIHSTTAIKAIRKLVTCHEIINLNLMIADEYKLEKIWDKASLSDLSMLRSELVLFHRVDFKPITTIDIFSNQVKTLVWYFEK